MVAYFCIVLHSYTCTVPGLETQDRGCTYGGVLVDKKLVLGVAHNVKIDILERILVLTGVLCTPELTP
jgi:hypothetical protein